MKRLVMSATVIASALLLGGAGVAAQPAPVALEPGAVFRDCDRICPEMVVVPAGVFTIGSSATEEGSARRERPQREVTIARPFAVGRFEVTFDEWDACVKARGCRSQRETLGPRTVNVGQDESWGRGRRPVINVHWRDAQDYVRWLSEKAGKRYRLLSEAEWEYAARAGTTTPYVTGDTITPADANYVDSGHGKTLPVGSYRANPFGLYDMQGNVWEWLQDCSVEDYFDLPPNGAPIPLTGCEYRVLRGGAWLYRDVFMRSAHRHSGSTGPYGGDSYTGFRVARSL